MKILIPSLLLALGAGSSLVLAAAEPGAGQHPGGQLAAPCADSPAPTCRAPVAPCPPAPPVAPVVPVPWSVVVAPPAPAAAPSAPVAWSVAPQETAAPAKAPCCPLARVASGLAELERAVSAQDLAALEVDVGALVEQALALRGEHAAAQVRAVDPERLARAEVAAARARAEREEALSSTSAAQNEVDRRVLELERLLGEEAAQPPRITSSSGAAPQAPCSPHAHAGHGEPLGAAWAQALEELEGLGEFEWLEQVEGLGELEWLEQVEALGELEWLEQAEGLAALEAFGTGPWTWAGPGQGSSAGAGSARAGAPVRAFGFAPGADEELRAIVRDLRAEVDNLRGALRDLRAEMKHISAGSMR